MKNLTLGILLALALAGCTQNEASKTIIANENFRHMVLEINGMYCASCGPGIAKMFSEAEGIIVAKVSNKEDKGELIYDATKIAKEQIVSMLRDPYSGKIVEDMPASQEMIDRVKTLSSD